MDISILLIDDDADLVELYKRKIEQAVAKRKLQTSVTVATNPQKALAIARNQLFDILIIDAKLDYKGVNYGGILLADDLRGRYGANSILIISRYITRSEVAEHGSDHVFIGKSDEGNGQVFIKTLTEKVFDMRSRQFAFVAMPFNDSFQKLYQESIVQGLKDGGLQSYRADEVLHNKAAAQKMLELIWNSKLVLFLADTGNANAYYEAGYAHGREKEVMVVAKSPEELKFDIAHLNIIAHRDKPEVLRFKIKQKLMSLRLEYPIGV